MHPALRVLGKIVHVYLVCMGAVSTLVLLWLWTVASPRELKPRRLGEYQLKKLCTTLELYRLDNGHYPSTEQGLDALMRRPEMEPLPAHYPPVGYARKSDLVDPWGEPLSYTLEADGPVVRILGAPDGKVIEGCR